MTKFYVRMNDTFMSGWGMATGKTNVLCIACDNITQAKIIYSNAKNRSEMKYVDIVHNPTRDKKHYIVTYKHWDDMGDIWKR